MAFRMCVQSYSEHTKDCEEEKTSKKRSPHELVYMFFVRLFFSSPVFVRARDK